MRPTLRGGPKSGPCLGASLLVIVALSSGLGRASQQQPHASLWPRAGYMQQEYYYTRTRQHPNHLRVSEDYKNNYVDEVRLESTINGTKWQYYRAEQVASFDELVFETIDKIFRHRLSAFYIHHFDNDDDKRRSSDPKRVSSERCARDLMYLVDKLPSQHSANDEAPSHERPRLSPELGALFDSYARPEAGVLMGNTYWVGAYHQCVERHIFDLIGQPGQPAARPMSRPSDSDKQQVVSFKGRYCVASLRAPAWPKLIEKRKLKSRSYFKTERQYEDYAKLFRIQMGVCLPDSCDSSTLERHYDEIRLLTGAALGSSASQHFSAYDLIDLYCLPDDSSPLRQWSGSALGLLLVLSTWLLCVLLATLADVGEFVAAPQEAAKVSTLSRLVAWLSLRANYRKLMHVSSEEQAPPRPATGANSVAQSPELAQSAQQQQQGTTAEDGQKATTGAEQPSAQDKSSLKQSERTQRESESDSATGQQQQSHAQVNLRFLNAFKVLIMFWIVNGHIMLLMIQTAKNILESDALLNCLMHFLIGATFGVDLFFTMTGFLTAYLLFNSGHARRMRLGAWLYLSFHRYWRLAPLYLLTFWFSRSVMQLLGSGPLWDYGTSALTYRGLCNQESWWYPLTLTSNLHGLFEECMITSWYISCDMQFWLVSPIYLHLLAHHPSAGWLASLATIAASLRVRYLSVLGDKSARYDELVQPRADIFMRVSHDLPALYTHPHYRISAYIVGLLAGHYVYMIKSGAWSSSLVQLQASSAPPKQATSATRGSAWRKSLMAYTGLVLFLLMAFVSYLLANYYPSSMLKYARVVSAYGYAIDHLLMSLGASLIIVAMCLGQWPRLTRLLSHPNWTRLSKINYALLLLQCEAIYFQIFRFEQVPLAGTRELINILFNLILGLYPLALVVTLVFEYPLANLEKLLLGGAGRVKESPRAGARKQKSEGPDVAPERKQGAKQKLI